MGCQEDLVVEKVCDIYDNISRLESLHPSKDVNMLLTQLVLICMPPTPIDLTKLCERVQDMRSKLIKLCGEAEGLLESHFSTILGTYDNPLHHINIFPYYNNYLKLSHLEFNLLGNHCTHVPNQVAFLGSGPLPLTSIVLASYHLTTTSFHNYDIDPSANFKASQLVSSDPDLSKRMSFHTADVMNLSEVLNEYEIVFLAALVGMDKEEKVQIIDHLATYMAPGALLLLRSAHGARAFLYPVINPCDLQGFEVLSIYHPTDEVINSIVVARKYLIPVHSHDQGLDHIILPSNMIEELTIEEQLS